MSQGKIGPNDPTWGREGPEAVTRLPATPGAGYIGAQGMPHDPTSAAGQVSGGALERLEIPGYQITDILGRGGMAVVYKAVQQSLRREVALKVILGGACASREELARFRIETESVAQLKHPNIVQIYEVSQQDGCPFCSLEFVEGGTLAQRHRDNPLTPMEAAVIVEKLARAIDAAHLMGIIHRDLKPSNVLLTTAGEPKISDFGVAKRLDSDVAETKTGAVVGTPGYMSPEQAAGAKLIGPAADIYGLGAILYELLTGRPPFHAATSLDTILQVISEEPVSPRKLKPTVPLDLETICLKCLEKEPRRRYTTAQELADDLLRFIQGEPIVARPPNIIGRIDRWARLRPMLASQLAAAGFLYSCHLLLFWMGDVGPDPSFHRFATCIAVAWAAGACAFQWLSTKTLHALGASIAWCAFDIIMLTILLLKADGPKSPLVPAYFLLVAASTFRFSRTFVWAVTLMSVASYLGIVIEASLHRPEYATELKFVIFIVISLLLLGLIQHFLVRRVRNAIRAERRTSATTTTR